MGRDNYNPDWTSIEQELLGIVGGKNDQWYNHLFGGVHMAGKVLATAFGGGALADAAEQLESPILPDWAKTKKDGSADSVVTLGKPDFVVVVKKDGKADTLTSVTSVTVTGGKRFDGNGYKSGDPLGKKFSFGVDGPTKTEVTTKMGAKTIVTDAKQVLFGGGSETGTRVVGLDGRNDMDTFDLLGEDWTELVEGLREDDEGPVQAVRRGKHVKGHKHDDFRVLGDAILGELIGGETGRTTMPLDPEPLDVTDSDSIYGDNDKIYGIDCVGAVAALGAAVRRQLAVPSRAGFVMKKTPGGRQYTSLVVKTAKTHRDAIANARDVAKRAQSMGGRFLSAINAGRLGKVTVKGDTVLGAVPLRMPTKSGRPVKALTAAQMKKAASDLVKAGKELEKRAAKHEKLLDQKDKKLDAARAKVAKAAARTSSTPSRTAAKAKPATRVRGYEELEASVDGATYDDHVWDSVVGDACADILGAPTDPDPTNPGYLINGDPDPAAGGANPYAAGDPYGGAGGGGGSAAGMDGPPDYGMEPAPTEAPPMVSGEDYIPDPYAVATADLSPYSSAPSAGESPVPVGAVYYEGQKPLGWQSVGSVTRFTGASSRGNANREAYAISTDQLANDGGWGVSGYQLGGGDAGIMDGWYLWWEGNQSGQQYKKDEPGGGLRNQESKTLHERAGRSIAFGFGPLVGNPGSDDFKSLRLDTATEKWFWYGDKAPAWATAARDLERFNKALLAWNTEKLRRKTEYDAAVLQDQLDAKAQADMARQQAAQDAQMAMQQQQQDAQAAQQQAQLEQQQAASEAQYAQQMSQLDVQERAQELEYAKTHPEYYEGGGGTGDLDSDVDWGQERDYGDGGGGGGDVSSADLEADIPQE